MGKPKDCYGTLPEEYTCNTPDCLYVQGCISLVIQRTFDKRIRKHHNKKPYSKTLGSNDSPARRNRIKSLEEKVAKKVPAA